MIYVKKRGREKPYEFKRFQIHRWAKTSKKLNRNLWGKHPEIDAEKESGQLREEPCRLG